MIADAGAAITAGPGCVALDAHTVRCTVQRELFLLTRRLRIDVGNRADEVDVRANEPPVVFGRQGHDRLTSAKGDNGVLEGGPGDDRP